ncbi:uncharacterized protein N7458_002554 [Penicillium daleae]|uniref:Uncharacterized protein n=1 Tax=Penicillium daleae TaxID=63821 RepID=A0AAD6G7A2_9EURO|nr:uncharacterized protein N7458_002554 [Penicillium daleae]KAJ5461002.1 hypothetical protein N7458_002554 [Penicillium daleae]
MRASSGGPFPGCFHQGPRPSQATPQANPPGSQPRARAVPLPNPDCVVCCRPIEPSNREKETWKSFYQPLGFDTKTGELLAAQRYQPGCSQVHMHSCCWEVAQNVTDFMPLNQTSLMDFARHLLNLKPFATQTPFDCETNDVDHELWAETQHNPESDTNADHECRGILSSAAFKKITRWLKQNPLTANVDDVQKIDKCLAYCISRGMPYALASDKDMNIRPNLMRALQNLQTSDASRFPKTYNLRVAWDNIQSALDAMKSSPLPRVLRPIPELNASRRIIKFCIPTEKCHRLTFSFIRMQIKPSGLQPSMIISGFGYDGKGLGCWGENHILRVQALKGLHLARDSFAGFTAIRVKNNEKWSEWFGTPRDGVDDLELEWETKKNLILHFDKTLNRITGAGIKSRVSDLPL